MESKFKAEFNAEMDRIRGFYPNTAAMLLPALHAAQKERGWISDETMQDIADYLQIPKTRVKEVVTFYHMFHLKPVGKYELQFCNNIACWLRGSEELIHHAEKKCGISMGETTKDKMFTITEVECLGSCGTAPVCRVNEDYHENLDLAAVDRLLGELR
jgi:NADH-quinone oxidoreductase E subunit